MFREDHTRSRSRSRDAASGSGNRRVVIVLVPPLPVFFASRRHLPPPNIWLAILWLVLGIDFGVVPWTSGNRGYASPSPFEGAEFRAVSEPRALFEPLSGLRPLQFSETSHCISVEGSRPSANMYHAPLPIEGKMSLRCRAGIMPCLDPPVEPMPYPHLCTRYRGATECSDRANPDVRQATPLHAYLCGLRSRALRCSATYLYCPHEVGSRCHPPQAQRGPMLLHQLQPFAAPIAPGLPARSQFGFDGPVHYTHYEAPPGSQVPGTSQVLATALSTSPSNKASYRCGVRSEGCEPCHGVR